MTLRFSTSRAVGAAIVLTLGSVASAAAQTPVRKDVPANPGSSSRLPVTKDRAPVDTASSMPAPAPTPAPTPAPEPAPAPATTTTEVQTTTTTTSTGEVPPATMSGTRFGNGFYIGVAGAAAFPQNDLNNYYRTGYGVEVPIGWDPANSPLGLRVNLGYNRLRGDTRFNYRGTNGTMNALQDPQIYQAVADAKLRLPFGRFLGATSGLYAVGGGGVYYFRNYQNTLAVTTNPGTGGVSTGVTNAFNPEDKTQFGANVGGGLSFGVGRASLFVESRYVRIFTQNRNSDYVPVVLGVTLH